MTRVQEIFKLTKQLFPTGRAFWLSDEDIKNFFTALCESEATAFDANLSILDSILPDNDNFTETDASLWEKRLNLKVAPDGVSLNDRKDIIARKYAFPGEFDYRQNWRFLQYQLQQAGYNVWVHENRFPDGGGGWEYIDEGSQSAVQHWDDTEHGWDTETGGRGIDIVANLATPDEPYDTGDPTNFKGAFYVGGETFPDRAIVHPSLEEAFRQLILSIKPANTFAILLIDYVHTGNLSFVNGEEIILINNDNLELVAE